MCSSDLGRKYETIKNSGVTRIQENQEQERTGECARRAYLGGVEVEPGEDAGGRVRLRGRRLQAGVARLGAAESSRLGCRWWWRHDDELDSHRARSSPPGRPQLDCDGSVLWRGPEPGVEEAAIGAREREVLPSRRGNQRKATTLQLVLRPQLPRTSVGISLEPR